MREPTNTWPDLSGNGHDGVIVESVTYSRALTDQEIKTAHKYVKRQYRMLWYQRLWDWLARIWKAGAE